MNIETLRILELTPDPNNARQHDDKNLKAIMGSLKEFGQRKPIVITEAGTIVAGNGTVEAAKRLGWLDIEVVRVPSDWTDAQVKAFAIADNRTAELANWNQEVLTSQLLELEAEGWELAEFGFEALELPDDDKPIIEDGIPESAPSRVALGDIWQLGNHRLMCGDASNSELLNKLLDGKQVNAIVTDPPYGIGIDGQKLSTNKNPKHNRKAHEFRDWDSQRPPKSTFDLILSFDVPTVIWGGNYFADLLPATRGWLYWSKGQDGLTMSDGELAWTTESKPLRAITVNRGALQGSVHPTQKPSKVIEFSINHLGDKKTILDFFGGSGTTLIVCEQTNRVCYMMELDPKYCDVIIERWEKLTGQKAELLPAKAD
jgi:site-specific DNA-methyltransferase (adenine-specific)